MKNEINLTTFIKSYWNYYLELEEQLIETKKYVDFNESNYNTFSIEYLKLLQATCSEIDVVAKIIAETVDDRDRKNEKYNYIAKWGFFVQKAFPNIEVQTVSFQNDYILQPWRNWQNEQYKNDNNQLGYRLVNKNGKKKKNPEWWTAYNKVKHERTSHYADGKINYARANLKNLLNAMAALNILETLFIEYLAKTYGEEPHYKKSELFTFAN